MQINIISFTEKGTKLSEKISNSLQKNGHTPTISLGYGKYKVKLSDFAKEGFKNADGLIFISATGIAVRAIAPYIKNKITDPAVVVVDDTGKFSISLLSGHIGGGNSLCTQVAKSIRATPVITTATDNNNVFAIDTFAVENNYTIKNTKKIKNISSKLLANQTVNLYSDFPVGSELPPNIKVVHEVDEADIIISDVACSFEELTLIPKIYSVGIGCKKNTKVGALNTFVTDTLSKEYISADAIECISSVDVKKEERAIISLAKKLKTPFNTYTVNQLNKLKGEFTSSEFVQKAVGTDNVCERSAVIGNNGDLILRKTAHEGMTIAIAKREFKVDFKLMKNT